MVIPVMIDDLKCEAEISRISWFVALASMAIHPTEPAKWYYFRTKNVTHPKYRDWDYLDISVDNILWEELFRNGLHRWLINRLN